MFHRYESIRSDTEKYLRYISSSSRAFPLIIFDMFKRIHTQLLRKSLSGSPYTKKKTTKASRVKQRIRPKLHKKKKTRKIFEKRSEEHDKGFDYDGALIMLIILFLADRCFLNRNKRSFKWINVLNFVLQLNERSLVRNKKKITS